MGTCGVYARENTDNAPDIGFAFLPQFEGKGYGYESAHFMKIWLKMITELKNWAELR